MELWLLYSKPKTEVFILLFLHLEDRECLNFTACFHSGKLWFSITCCSYQTNVCEFFPLFALHFLICQVIQGLWALRGVCRLLGRPHPRLKKKWIFLGMTEAEAWIVSKTFPFSIHEFAKQSANPLSQCSLDPNPRSSKTWQGRWVGRKSLQKMPPFPATELSWQDHTAAFSLFPAPSRDRWTFIQTGGFVNCN